MDKKAIEKRYVEEARRASTLFPLGEFLPHERPDFLIPTVLGILGVEVTELCREDPRAEAGRLGKVARKAKALYSRRPRAKPVDVSPVFLHDVEDLRVDALAASLAEFVYAHRDSNASYTRGLPEGYLHIGVFPALDTQGQWRYFRAGNTTLASRELIGGRIAEKNGRVADYRAAATEVWLLIVNDLFLGPGEVHTRPEDLAVWTFDFAFDKALLFSRQPGGSGQVIELLRQ